MSLVPVGIWGNGSIGKLQRQVGQRDLLMLRCEIQDKSRVIAAVLFVSLT